MADKLHRFIFENIHVRGEWVKLQTVWKEIQGATVYPKAVRNVLGEALAAISLLAESLKLNGSLVLQIRGTSPVSMLVVQATSEGGLRGIVRWEKDAENLDKAIFSELFGQGTMAITVEPNDGGKRYQSLVSIQGANLAECLRDYFEQSEQLNTRLWLSADENNVAGFMLQSLPDDDRQDDSGWQHATVLADTLTDTELLELDVDELLQRLYHQDKVRLFEAKALRFECTCSQQKIEDTIRSIGETEANQIIREQGSIGIDCEFCNAHYELDKVDVKKLFVFSGSNNVSAASDVSGSVH